MSNKRFNRTQKRYFKFPASSANVTPAERFFMHRWSFLSETLRLVIRRQSSCRAPVIGLCKFYEGLIKLSKKNCTSIMRFCQRIMKRSTSGLDVTEQTRWSESRDYDVVPEDSNVSSLQACDKYERRSSSQSVTTVCYKSLKRRTTDCEVGMY